MKKIITSVFALLSLATYSQTQKGSNLTGDNAGDLFGSSVSVSANGNTMVVGASENDDSGTNAGQVKVFEWNGSAWIQKGASLNGEAANDQFGHAVSMSADGNTFIAGAPQNDGTGSNAGHARVYNWNGSAWVQMGSDIDGEAAYDQLGRSVQISKDATTIIIGAIYNEGSGATAGHARVYSWNGSAWVQKGADIDAENASEQSGYSVSVNEDGTVVAVSSPENDDNGTMSGHVRIFEWNGSNWAQRGSNIEGEAADDLSGYSINLSANGSVIAIGSHRNSALATDGGSVRIYDWNGSAWVQRGADIDGAGSYGNLGLSVSLSDDGNTLAAGAPYHSYGMYTFEGYAKVFVWNGSTWSPLASEVQGAMDSDNMGDAVQISGDGSTLVSAAPNNDSNGSNSGLVSAYTFSTAELHEMKPTLFSVHPNPFLSSFKVKVEKQTSYMITDVKGKIVQQGFLDAVNNEVVLLEQEKGIYFLNLEGDVVKVMKK